MSTFAESVLFLAASRAFRPDFSGDYPGFWKALDALTEMVISIGCLAWAVFLMARWSAGV